MVLQQAMMEADVPIIDPVIDPDNHNVEAQPHVIEEQGRGGVFVNIGCQICLLGVAISYMFLPCGHCACHECANTILIWRGTDETCPAQSRCFYCRGRVRNINRIYL